MDAGSGRREIKKYRTIFLAVVFAVYMFEYMVTLTFIDQRSTGLFSSSRQLILHYAGYVLISAGFVCFALVRRRLKSEKVRIRTAMSMGFIYFICVTAFYFLQSRLIYSVMALMVTFSLGVLGGMVYFCMSLAPAQISCIGKVMAAGASAAVLLQYFLQEYLDLGLGIPVVLGLGFFAALWIVIRKPWEPADGQRQSCDRESSEAAPDIRRRLLILSLTVVALSVIGTFYDTQMMRLNVQTNYQEFNYYSWPRLFIIGGYILIGFIGDIKKQKYVPIAVLCLAMFAVFNPLLFDEPANYYLNMSLYYVCLGTNISYFNLMFWNIAGETGNPRLWAGMGRVISGVADSVLAAACVADLPLNLVIGLDIVMFAALVLLLAAGGYLLLGHEKGDTDKCVDEVIISPEERLQLYARHCSLTPRETEVLEKLLTTEDDLQKIADSLFISRRMVQRYVSSIYEKTKTKTRIGLLRSYVDFTAD